MTIMKKLTTIFLVKEELEMEKIFDNQCKICGNELVLGQCNACQEKLNSLTGTENQKDSDLLGNVGEVLEEKYGGSCIGGESLVITNKWPMSLKEIVEGNDSDLKVLSFDPDSYEMEYCGILERHTNG